MKSSSTSPTAGSHAAMQQHNTSSCMSPSGNQRERPSLQYGCHAAHLEDGPAGRLALRYAVVNGRPVQLLPCGAPTKHLTTLLHGMLQSQCGQLLGTPSKWAFSVMVGSRSKPGSPSYRQPAVTTPTNATVMQSPSTFSCRIPRIVGIWARGHWAKPQLLRDSTLLAQCHHWHGTVAPCSSIVQHGCHCSRLRHTYIGSCVVTDLAQEQLDAGKHDDRLEHREPLAIIVECLEQVLQPPTDR
jgi:hypothetical protein